jgi:hypothetical protein
MARSVCGGAPPPSRALRVSSGNGLRPPSTAEPLHPLRSETKGQARACPTGRGPSPARCGSACYRTACAELTVTVTATAATNGKRQRPATAQNTRTIRANSGYVRPKNGRSCNSTAPPRTGPTHYGRMPRDAPEPPSTANDRHQQQSVNMKLARALNPTSNARDTLVMRGSRPTRRGRSRNAGYTRDDLAWPTRPECQRRR